VAQFARPIQDIARGSWTTHTGGTTNLFATLNEGEPGDDTAFIQSATAANDAYECRLSTVQVALIDRLHVLRYRGRKSAVGGNTRGLIVELRQGATVIASNTHADLTAVMADAAILLTKQQGAAITDYADLRVRFTSTGTFSGGGAQRRRVEVSWCQLRVPDWQPTYENQWGAIYDDATPGVVRLTIDDVTVEAATLEEAQLRLAEAIRDTYDDDYDDPRYRLWGFVRQPMARYAFKVKQYEGMPGAEAKMASLLQRRDAQELIDRDPPTFTTPPPTETTTTTTVMP
jgi:hypothetical protein